MYETSQFPRHVIHIVLEESVPVPAPWAPGRGPHPPTFSLVAMRDITPLTKVTIIYVEEPSLSALHGNAPSIYNAFAMKDDPLQLARGECR